MPPIPTSAEDELRLERLRQRRRAYPFWRLVRANLRDLRLIAWQARITLLCLLAALFANVAYLLLIYFPAACADGAPAFCTRDVGLAFYATLRMMVFETDLDLPADWLGRVLFFALPLLGLFFLLSSVVNVARLLFDKGSRPQEWQISLAHTARNHVIVVGLGRVGYRVVLQLLAAGYDVVVVEQDWRDEFVPTVLRLKVPVVCGDGRDPDILRLAAIKQARGCICAINDDLKNIEIALTARSLRNDLPTVLRIYHRALDHNLERSFGRNSAFSSSALAAPTFAAATISRDIVHVLALPEALLGLTEITIAPNTALPLARNELETNYRVRVLRHRDAQGRELLPRGTDPSFRSGDVVLVLGALPDLEALRLANRTADTRQQRPDSAFPSVIICGLGKVGSAVIQLLLHQTPTPRIVLICTPETPASATAPLIAAGVTVIHGDAREPEVLHTAGIERAYAVAALFSNDLTNLQIGLAARELRPDLHLVLRVFSDVLAQRLATIFGINTAYSTSSLAAPTLAAAAIQRDIDYAFDIGERLVIASTHSITPNDTYAGTTIGILRTQRNLSVIRLKRDAQVYLLPDPTETLRPGDEIVILRDVRG
jgi:Trk K+ transport system NAD-binding subunit